MRGEPLLRIRGLEVDFHTDAGTAKAVAGVDLDIFPGEIVGLVGESGSGKSVTALSVLRLIPTPPGEIVAGSVVFRGRNLLDLGWDEIRRVRGKDIGMIFQEPMTSLNPVLTIGAQVMEVLLQHEPITKPEAFERAVAVLEQVGIPEARLRMQDYPHQFSGGMRQRVMIAIALACNPALLIADEPTTALDVTIQAQILDLIVELMAAKPDAAVLLITHNLAVVAETCQRVVVLYGGRVQEQAPVDALFASPLHPYTVGLLGSLPAVDGEKRERLRAIPGMVPGILDMPRGCKFVTRCNEREAVCETTEPDLREIQPGRWVRCHLRS